MTDQDRLRIQARKVFDIFNASIKDLYSADGATRHEAILLLGTVIGQLEYESLYLGEPESEAVPSSRPRPASFELPAVGDRGYEDIATDYFPPESPLHCPKCLSELPAHKPRCTFPDEERAMAEWLAVGP